MKHQISPKQNRIENHTRATVWLITVTALKVQLLVLSNRGMNKHLATPNIRYWYIRKLHTLGEQVVRPGPAAAGGALGEQVVRPGPAAAYLVPELSMVQCQ